MDTASTNGEYAWDYDNYELIVKNSTEIAQMIMEISEKTIKFEEEELFLDVIMELQELGIAIQDFIDQYEYTFLFFNDTFSLKCSIICFRRMNENDLTSGDMMEVLSEPELYSVVNNLDLVLQCWKPKKVDNQEDCKNSGSIAK